MPRATRTYLTEPQAWREIGRRLENPRYRFTGLCYQITRLGGEDRIARETEWVMRRRLRDHLADARRAGQMPGMFLYGGYDERGEWVTGAGKYRPERAMGCYWMALEAEAGAAS